MSHANAPQIRPPAVAGTFYPEDAATLAGVVDGHLERAVASDDVPDPKALIAPHAGYVYSGPVAGSAYALLQRRRPFIERVILIGPSHRVTVRGLAAPEARAFRTPLGDVDIDRETIEGLRAVDGVRISDAAHAEEHSLEVQLPFLQRVLADFALVPLVAGDADADEIAEVLGRLWGGPETLIVISSDLSHYHGWDVACRLDAETSHSIEALAPERLGRESACGRIPLSGLLIQARARGLRAHVLDVRNSGDTAGPRDRVVGYGAYAVA